MTVFSLASPMIGGLEVDLFVEPPIDFETAWARAVRVALDTTSATVASIQDLVAMKRASGRPIDLADVEALEAIARRAGDP
jgi:hypothetical protein